MSHSRNLIIGLDPGTTVGLAVSDIKGNILLIKSFKNISQSELINIILKLGNPLLAGCDKSKTPSYVAKIAALLGMKVVSPRRDLSVKEKKELVGSLKTTNTHEFDALASAILAYKEYEALFKKVDRFLKKTETLKLGEELKRILIKKNGLNIHRAYDFIYMENTAEAKITKKITHSSKLTNKDFISLLARVSNLNDETKALKSRIAWLEEELDEKNKIIKKYKKTYSKELAKIRKESLVLEKDKKINILHSKLREKDKKLKEKDNKIKKYRETLLNLDGRIICKALETLSREKLIKEIDKIIYIRNPEIFSKKTLGKINGKILISRKKFPQTIRERTDAYFIEDTEKTKVVLYEIDDFVIVNKKNLDKILYSKKTIRDIIKKYQKRFSNQ